MRKKGKKIQQRAAQGRSQSGYAAHGQRRKRSLEKRSSEKANRGLAGGWFLSKRPVLRFVLVFCVLVLVINVLLLQRIQEMPIVFRFLTLNAELAGGILRILGEDVTVTGRSILGGYPLEVSHGCDAVQPMALFVSAVVATPVMLRRKAIGAIIGIGLLLSLNLLRIVGLYYVGMFIPKYFHLMYVEIGGAVFILFSITLWLLWVSWAIRQRTPRPEHAVAKEQTPA